MQRSSSLRREFLVDDMNSETFSGALHLGHEVSQVLDGLHLLLQEVALQEVGELGIVMLASCRMNFQKSLKRDKVDLKSAGVILRRAAFPNLFEFTEVTNKI